MLRLAQTCFSRAQTRNLTLFDMGFLNCLVFFYSLLGAVEFLVLFYNLECRMLELWLCLLLVYFVSAAGCHCFDLNRHNFAVIAQMIMKFGTGIKLYVFYTMLTKKFVTSLLLRNYDAITCISVDALV